MSLWKLLTHTQKVVKNKGKYPSKLHRAFIEKGLIGKLLCLIIDSESLKTFFANEDKKGVRKPKHSEKNYLDKQNLWFMCKICFLNAARKAIVLSRKIKLHNA